MSCSIRLWFAYGFFLNKISNSVELEGNVSLIVRGVQTVWLVQFSIWFLKTETKLNMWETELCKTEIFLFRFLFQYKQNFLFWNISSFLTISRKKKWKKRERIWFLFVCLVFKLYQNWNWITKPNNFSLW